jgi:ABC-type bacteriocin/lantibiotic exporter with double-glycine peptidase domain
MATQAVSYVPAAAHGGEVRPWHRLRAMLSRERSALWTAIIYSIAIALLSLALPVATQSVVNTIAFGNLLQPLLILTLTVAGLLVLSGILQMIRFYVVEMIQRRVFVQITSDSVNRLLRARIDSLQLRNGPELVNRWLEVASVQKSAATLLVDGLSIVMQTLAGMVLLGLYHPWLLAFDALLVLALLVVVFPLGFHAVETAVKESKAKYALVAWLEEIARHARVFRPKSPGDWAFARTNELVHHYLHYRALHFRILLRQYGGALLIQAIASAALLGVGGLLVIQRQLTLGQLVAAELVVAAVVSGISKMAKHLESYYDMLASVDKLGMLTDLPVEQEGAEPPVIKDGPASVEVRTPNFTVRIAPGERVGMDGVSGSGKTLFADAVCGFRQPPGWTVEIDGVDIRHLRLAELRTGVQLVRGVEIFEGTILENIRVGREDVSLQDIQATLELLGVWEALQALPDALNTQLATGGAPLSEGQAQILMIARAIVARPRLLILDETLDYIMDAKERERITEVVFRKNQPWTLLVVTSRPDLLARCDKVVDMPMGTVRRA